jgi:hypothetical protein
MEREGFTPENPPQLIHRKGQEQKKLLKHIVRRQYPTLPREAQRRYVAQLGKRLTRVLRDRPPGFGDPLLYSILRGRADEIARQAASQGMALPSQIHLGLLPSRRAHATVVSFQNGEEYLVAFSEGLLAYLHSAASCLAQMVPFSLNRDSVTFDLNKPSAIIESNPEAVDRFHINVLYHAEGLIRKLYTERGEVHAVIVHQPTMPPPYTVEWPRSVFLQDLRDGMELFAVGHEYAHIMDRYAAKDSAERTIFDSQWAENYSDEHAADLVGANLATTCLIERKTPL